MQERRWGKATKKHLEINKGFLEEAAHGWKP